MKYWLISTGHHWWHADIMPDWQWLQDDKWVSSCTIPTVHHTSCEKVASHRITLFPNPPLTHRLPSQLILFKDCKRMEQSAPGHCPAPIPVLLQRMADLPVDQPSLSLSLYMCYCIYIHTLALCTPHPVHNLQLIEVRTVFTITFYFFFARNERKKSVAISLGRQQWWKSYPGVLPVHYYYI